MWVGVKTNSAAKFRLLCRTDYSKVLAGLFLLHQGGGQVIPLQPGGLHGGEDGPAGGGGSGAAPELTGPPQGNAHPAARVSRLTRC